MITISRFLNLLATSAFAIMVLIPSLSVADDTEIYLGTTAQKKAVKPNVLFILDTSGSMSVGVDSKGDRMDHMKAAFNDIMDTVNNINVGLMRFTDPGGPILWPISDIDADAAQIEAGLAFGMDINARVDSPSDDAEESSAGAVDLTSGSLDLLLATAEGTTLTVEDDPGMRLQSQADNAETLASNNLIRTQTIFNLNSSQINGLRFPSVPIPRGSTITDARVIFQGIGGFGSPTFPIDGFAEDDMLGFSTGFGTLAPSIIFGAFIGNPRFFTAASVDWSPNPWSLDEKGNDTTTVNLSSIVQEIIDRPGWESGNALGFRFGQSSSGGGRDAFTFLGAGNFGRGNAAIPELQVTFTAGSAGSQAQTVGIRFNNVGIPQGAAITNAFIEFSPADTGTVDINVDIRGEDADNAVTFATEANNLSSRQKTSAAVNWIETDDWDDLNDVHQTADLSSIIQEIVDRPEWCGNNSLALFIQESVSKANGPLSAFSFEGDPSRAPVLRVDFDETSIGADACIKSTVSSKIQTSNDDVEEQINRNGRMRLRDANFGFNSNQITGLRFQDIPITQGATITAASLQFVARSAGSQDGTVRFQTEASDNAAAFTSTRRNVSSRSRSTNAVDWVLPDFLQAGNKIITVDIAPIIQEVVNRSGWRPFNSLVIIQQHLSGGGRNLRSFDHSALDSAVLSITAEGVGATTGITVRKKLKELVDGFDHAGFTPIVDTLYEAALYYRGESVDWGKNRGFRNNAGNFPCFLPHACNGTNFFSRATNNQVRQNTRVSHPSSWTGGTVTRPANCRSTNLNSINCIDEVITGNPTYISPVKETCQANYIVLLTDGSPNNNDSSAEIESKFGLSCDKRRFQDGRLVNFNSGRFGETVCGPELVEHLATADQVAGLAGDQVVSTYTIGFGRASEFTPSTFAGHFLRRIAKKGKGKMFFAATGAELASVFQVILSDILNRPTSFAAPALTTNSFRDIKDRDQIYFSLFNPDTRVAWPGNIKRYRVCQNPTEGCKLGKILDANDQEAISPTDKRIKEKALSFWSSAADGPDVKKGGSEEQVPSHTRRQVFTFHDLTDPLVNPINENLSGFRNIVRDRNNDGILDGLASASRAHPDPRADTHTLLGDDGQTLSSSEVADLIDWIRGQDVDDEDDDGNTTENRFNFSDSLHASPLAIPFGGTAKRPVVKLFIAGNDGGLRMLNAETGIEEWVWYPQGTLKFQKELRENGNGDHIYGLDLTPVPWIEDRNGDGVITKAKGDFVRIIVGQRRGGSNYYAIDVTPERPVPLDPRREGDIVPTLLWRIEGGSDNYPLLGQTWSRPTVTKIQTGALDFGKTQTRDILVFGGGYDEVQDNGFFGPSSPGNAIYFADAHTGDLVFTISSDDPGVGENLLVPEMNCPIPSDVAAFDSDRDGLTDRLYVGDLCGQVWRADLSPNKEAGFTGITSVVGKFAELSQLNIDPTLVVDHRKIFFPPQVAQVLNNKFTAEARYDIVALATGRRDNPLNVSVQDRAYLLRDFTTGPMTDANADGLADSPNTISGPIVGNPGQLFDATTFLRNPTGADLSRLQNAKGYYIDFEGNGEKAMDGTTLLKGKWDVTTYLPEGVLNASACSLSEGVSRIYPIQILSGAVAANYDDPDDKDLTNAKRSYLLGSGVATKAIPIFSEDGITLLVGGAGGGTEINPNTPLPRGRTFWFEQ